MKISLVAHTQVAAEMEEIFLPLDGDNPTGAELLSEFAGRACYQSWDRPNPATRTNADYLANILKQQHYSVLEHASFTVYVEGVSRALLTELTRHRHLSFSVLSQRFVNESDADYVVPPALIDHWDSLVVLDAETDVTAKARDVLAAAWDESVGRYKGLVDALEARGLSRKQAREAARAVLPNMTETKIVVTGNHRAWREVIAKRNSPHADAEIQEFAREILSLARVIAPALYTDL